MASCSLRWLYFACDNSFCWTCCCNASVELPEGGPLKAKQVAVAQCWYSGANRVHCGTGRLLCDTLIIVQEHEQHKVFSIAEVSAKLTSACGFHENWFSDNDPLLTAINEISTSTFHTSLPFSVKFCTPDEGLCSNCEFCENVCSARHTARLPTCTNVHPYCSRYCLLLTIFRTINMHVMLLSILQSVQTGAQKVLVFWRSSIKVHLQVEVELTDILKVRNAYVQSVHCVTERAICNLLYKSEADQKDWIQVRGRQYLCRWRNRLNTNLRSSEIRRSV